MRFGLALFVGAGLVCAAGAVAGAQSYPERTIRLIVPAGPAGPTDMLGRLIADRLTASLHQTVIVDNRGGGGGAIGARVVAAADPDGYTLLFGNTATLANIPAVSKSAGYDGVKSFAAVAKVTDSYQVLVVRPDFVARSVAELLAYARANPGKLNASAAGVGNLTQLSTELLRLKAGIDLVTVMYKSGAESVTALLSGQVDLTIDNVTVLHSLISDGKLRALAVTSAARQPEFPSIPTMVEAGVPDYVVTSFFGVVAPAGTPPLIVSKLNAAVNEALRSDLLGDSLKAIGAAPSIETPEQFAAFIATEAQKWTAIAIAAGIRTD